MSASIRFCRLPSILEHYLFKLRWVDDCDLCDIQALQYLLDNGAAVTEKTLKAALRPRDSRLIDLLVRHTSDISQYGGILLAEAACNHNLKVVRMLLDAGVDVNTDVDDGTGTTISILASVISGKRRSKAGDPGENVKIVRLLKQQGAYFRLSAAKRHPYYLLEYILNHGFDSTTLEAIRYIIVNMGCDLRDPSVPSASLLEACMDFDKGKRAFQILFRNGAQLQPGSPLAAWIVLDGGIDLIQEMLAVGVDVNAYIDSDNTSMVPMTALQAAAESCREDVVALLLQQGADVNAPANDDEGRTALQASCLYIANTAEQRARQMKIIHLLLAHGANVNAAPARVRGGTALQIVAATGDLELAILLLFSCTPMADVNAPPCQKGDFAMPPRNALDGAAENGRIDMVKLLLGADALSCRRGGTGYDGAIQLAEEQGHLAVADLIRQHAESDKRYGNRNQYLSQLQRDWRECGYGSDSTGRCQCAITP